MPTYTPEPRICTWRWGNLHVFAICSFVGAVTFDVASLWSQDRQPLVTFLISIPFLAFGSWGNLKCWNERIAIGPSGIEWIDMLGKSKVRASLDQIIGVIEGRSGPNPRISVETSQGAIVLWSDLKGQKELITEVERVIASKS